MVRAIDRMLPMVFSPSLYIVWFNRLALKRGDPQVWYVALLSARGGRLATELYAPEVHRARYVRFDGSSQARFAPEYSQLHESRPRWVIETTHSIYME